MNESTEPRRSKLEILTDVYKLTCEMEKRLTNADFLVLAVGKRQELLNEYEANRLQGEGEPEDPAATAEMKRLAKEVISRDTLITKALEEHRNAAKRDLAILQQTRTGYQNRQNAQPGRHMDYKE